MQKIMFNDKCGLTYAVLAGRKTMTRRIAYDGEIKGIHTGYITEGVDAWKLALYDRDMIVAKSKYRKGEVVAVAQSYETMANSGHLEKMMETSSTFKKEYCGAGWNNKMFVKTDLMPHQIKITDIKVERLQDISDEDCLKEGILKSQFGDYWFYGFTPSEGGRLFKSPREAFAALIDKVSSIGTWERNPFVYAYTYELNH